MKICDVLKNSTISISEISKQTGIDVSILYKYRSGVKDISVRNAKKLGKLLKFNWWLVFEDENEK